MIFVASKRENEVISYLSASEKEIMDRYARKVKAARDVAVKRRKAELSFWREVDAREGEVYEHIVQRREQRQQQDGGNSDSDIWGQELGL